MTKDELVYYSFIKNLEEEINKKRSQEQIVKLAQLARLDGERPFAAEFMREVVYH